MNRMEKMKAEKDGLSSLSDLYAYVNKSIDEIPESELFRLRWYGFFYRKKQASFMVRIRIPSGKLSTAQARKIAELAELYGNNSIALTTRMGIQIREVALSNLTKVWEGLREAGLDSRQTGFDNVRNFMNCPVAGIQLEEAFDASDIIQELTDKLIGNPAFTNLPRKFNISVTGCHEDCGHSYISDIGLVPQVIISNNEVKEGFRIRFGGALGRFYAIIGEDLGVWLPKEQAVAAVLGLIELFRDHGDRANRKKARTSHFKEKWGCETLVEQLNKRLFPPLIKRDPDVLKKNHHDHIGIYPQRQKGFVYVGLTVPVGKMTTTQFREFLRLSDEYGSSELRLTPQQNIVVPFITENRITALKKEPLLQDFPYNPSPLLRGFIACTGKEGCDLAIVATKTPALQLITELESKLIIENQSLRIHWSGCPNSCAIVQTGDIGLHGTDLEIDGKFIDAVNIIYGGHIGHDAKIGTIIREKVPLSDLTATLIEILTDDQYFKDIKLKETMSKK